MEPVAKFISTLLASRTQAHIFHLQTTSYSAHKALQTYYEDIVDLIDSYVEGYQGKYEILKGFTNTTQIIEGEERIVNYFVGVSTFIDKIRTELPQDGALNNIVDEISALTASTLYKLRFLK
jgi:hypothetical protein